MSEVTIALRIPASAETERPGIQRLGWIHSYEVSTDSARWH